MSKNLLQIALTNDCNKSCSYCPIARWRGKASPTPLTNHILLHWLEAYPPEEWYIELTGGEPTLYSGLQELIEELSVIGYKGCIKTNGTNYIRPVNNFLRVVAWHDHLPTTGYYDFVLIIDDDAKCKYCEKHEIPYKRISYRDPHTGCDSYDCGEHDYERMLFLDPNSFVHSCTADKGFYTMFCEIPKTQLCKRCKTISDFDIFIRELK